MGDQGRSASETGNSTKLTVCVRQVSCEDNETGLKRDLRSVWVSQHSKTKEKVKS